MKVKEKKNIRETKDTLKKKGERRGRKKKAGEKERK
jgi:hypothetical protein